MKREYRWYCDGPLCSECERYAITAQPQPSGWYRSKGETLCGACVRVMRQQLRREGAQRAKERLDRGMDLRLGREDTHYRRYMEWWEQ